jgi:hypothetical protein
MCKNFKNVFIILLILFLSGCSDYDKAVKFEKKGCLNDASSSYKIYLAGNPKDMVKVANAQYFLGVLSAKNGKPEDAVTFFASAIVSGYDEKLVNHAFKKHIGDIKSNDFLKTRKFLNEIQDINDVFKEYSLGQLQKLKDIEKNIAVSNKRKLAKKYDSDRKNLEYVFTDSINSKEMSSKIRSYVLKQAQGDNEFEQRKDKVNLQKRYDDVLEKKFIYEFTSALPKYDFNAKQYNLSGKWGGFFPICSESNPDIGFPPIKINEVSAEALSNSKTLYNIEIIFRVTGTKFKEVKQSLGAVGLNVKRNASYPNCEVINAKAALDGETVYLIK